ncbi:MAG: hypothetical protein QW341_03600 [Candidatus Bathyarchaeia archaeon]
MGVVTNKADLENKLCSLEKRVRLLEAKLDVIASSLVQIADGLKTIAALYFEAEAKSSNSQPVISETFKKSSDMRPYNWLCSKLNEYMGNGFIAWTAEEKEDSVTVKIFKTEKTVEPHLHKVRGWLDWAKKAMAGVKP